MGMISLDTNGLFEIASGVACPTLFFVLVSYLLGLFVFGPLHARATWTPPNTRFRIVDIIILLVQLQITAGALFAVMPLLDGGEIVLKIALAFFIWSLQAFWWWTGVRMLAKARVERGADRVLFLSIILPLGYLTTLGIIASPVLLAVLIGALAYATHSFGWLEVALPLLFALAIAVPYAGAFGVRCVCTRIVDHAWDDVALDEGIAFQQLTVQPPSDRRNFPALATDREVRILDDTAQS
jgi:hypothetical protein